MTEKREMVKLLDERTIQVSLPTRIGYERIAMECSASFARMVGFVQERIEDLKTAVSEACLNAMEHGNKGRSEARVVVTLNFNENVLNIYVKDEGDGVHGIPEDMVVQERLEKLDIERGLRFYLMKRLVDQVDFNDRKEEDRVVKCP
jgi:serine/threonine-protein kinase RsbW